MVSLPRTNQIGPSLKPGDLYGSANGWHYPYHHFYCLGCTQTPFFKGWLATSSVRRKDPNDTLATQITRQPWSSLTCHWTPSNKTKDPLCFSAHIDTWTETSGSLARKLVNVSNSIKCIRDPLKIWKFFICTIGFSRPTTQNQHLDTERENYLTLQGEKIAFPPHWTQLDLWGEPHLCTL